ncbi:MAG: DUF2344 domain-containing protein [Lachnospiraceae bacterium]|nr:DUF2344 domain-containing protein [Lachnospiraceae bacterium]
MKIRIKFAKYGAIKYIGHLDVMRFFQKAIRRAGIDIKYSEGFSPHQIMSFAAPLGVGMESFGEYLDIEVNSMTSTKDMKDALNAASVDGIEILSVKILPDSCKNAMASVAAAGYVIEYNADYNGNADSNSDVNVNNGGLSEFPIENIDKKLADFYAQEQIIVNKKTKKSEIEIDLKSGIYEIKMDRLKDINLRNNNPVINNKDSSFVIYMLVNASSSGNIKPTMVMDAFCKYCNIELPTYSCRITRLDTYTGVIESDGSEKFIPLEEVGHD